MEEIEEPRRSAVAIATQIVQGEIAPYDGGETLVRMQRELEGLSEGLFPFIGPVSECERLPEHRAEYERQIVVLADRFRARFGT